MADITSLSSFLGDVADAIRSKTGKTDALAAEDFDTEIASISSGTVTDPLEITTNIVVEGEEYVTASSSPMAEDILIPAEGTVHISVDKETLAENIGLTADKILIGERVLDIDGTAEGGGTSQDAVMPIDIMSVKATVPITKGQSVEVTQNRLSSLSMVGTRLPASALIGTTSVSRYNDYSVVPYVSHSGQFLGMWFKNGSSYVLIPFYLVDGSWAQMKVNGAYASAYTYTSESDVEYKDLISCDEFVQPSLVVLGQTLYSMDTVNLNLTPLGSFSKSLDNLGRVYLYNHHIFVTESVSYGSSYTFIYKYDKSTNTISKVTNVGGAYIDITTNGTDVFLAYAWTIRKFTLSDGTYTQSATLSITHSEDYQGMSMAAGCTAIVFCEGNSTDGYAFRQHLIDPETLTYIKTDMEVTFSSSPGTILTAPALTKDFRYLFLDTSNTLNDDTGLRMYERQYSEDTGVVTYKFLGYPSTAIFSPSINPTYGILTHEYNFHGLTNVMAMPDDYYPEIYTYNPSNISADYYTAKPTTMIKLSNTLYGYGYALEDIAEGATGKVAMTVFDGGALDRIQDEASVVIANIDAINGEAI